MTNELKESDNKLVSVDYSDLFEKILEVLRDRSGAKRMQLLD